MRFVAVVVAAKAGRNDDVAFINSQKIEAKNGGKKSKQP
jgi:hypothetical protein